MGIMEGIDFDSFLNQDLDYLVTEENGIMAVIKRNGPSLASD